MSGAAEGELGGFLLGIDGGDAPEVWDGCCEGFAFI